MVNRDANENNRDAKRQPFGDINNMAYESEESCLLVLEALHFPGGVEAK